MQERLGPVQERLGPVALVEGNLDQRTTLTRWLEGRGHRVHVYTSGREVLSADVTPNLICLDTTTGDAQTAELIRSLSIRHPDVPIIVTVESEDSGTEALRAGAFDDLRRPVSRDRFLVKVDQALEHRGMTLALSRTEAELHEGHSFSGLVGKSASLRELSRQIERVFESDVSVVLYGESGVGKELVARAIHKNGRRSGGQFVAMNCAVLAPEAHEKELLGWDHAGSNQIGRVEQAHQGTLFLNEVAALSEAAQASLLRILEEGSARRIGSGSEYAADIRILCSTHRDLRSLVQTGQFREDLYMRLGFYPISVPPLRERRDDIALLASHFMRVYRADVGRAVTRLDHDAMQALQRYDWPNNIRELENVIHRAMLASDSEILRLDDLPPEIRNPTSHAVDAGSNGELLTIRELERRAIRQALKKTDGSVERAAKLLGMGRATLYRRLAAYSAERKA